MSEKTPIFELKNVDVIFKKNGALFSKPTLIGAALDINLEIGAGEVISLVGESGGGKSTIGNVITGLLKPTNGTILFEGKDVRTLNKEDKKKYKESIMLVNQDSYAALNPMHTIEHSLTSPLLVRKIAKNHDEAYKLAFDALDKVELSPPDFFLEKFPHQLSGGQRQRILLARALLMKPKIIVADEPVSMIDVSLRISMLNLLSKINRELNTALIYITHDLATARYVSRNGKIVVLYLGKVVESGAIVDVMENPTHPYLQTLLSAVPILDPDLEAKRKPLLIKSVDVPSVVNPPSGCRFHTRCVFSKDICEKDEPQLKDYAGHNCACHLKEELPKWSLF